MKNPNLLETPRTRRDFLVGSAAGTAGLLIAGCGLAAGENRHGEIPSYLRDGGVTPECLETEDNIQGPFYRPNAPFRTTLAAPGEGIPLTISGMVMGPGCNIHLDGALIDVWQANAEGQYDNNSPEFLWRGRMNADEKGNYSFQTIVPGRYLNGARYRPRHIHVTVTAEGYRSLTTQIYFAGDPYIEGDPWVRERLTIPLRREGDGYEGTFHIVLAPA
jgi:protocatechuate 3,4-dioxygenase beta subunit